MQAQQRQQGVGEGEMEKERGASAWQRMVESELGHLGLTADWGRKVVGEGRPGGSGGEMSEGGDGRKRSSGAAPVVGSGRASGGVPKV
jgi:hypothetical protein